MPIDLEAIRDYLDQNDSSASAMDYRRTAIALLAEVERLSSCHPPDHALDFEKPSPEGTVNCECGQLKICPSKTFPRLIPVTERLPEEGEYTLTYQRPEHDDELGTPFGVNKFFSAAVGRFGPMWESDESQGVRPTHWMPLPEQPK